MLIEVSQHDLGSLELTPQQGRIELAVGLYAGRQVTLGRGAQIAGLSYDDFMQELGRRGICINYTLQDAIADVDTVRQMPSE